MQDRNRIDQPRLRENSDFDMIHHRSGPKAKSLGMTALFFMERRD